MQAQAATPDVLQAHDSMDTEDSRLAVTQPSAEGAAADYVLPAAPAQASPPQSPQAAGPRSSHNGTGSPANGLQHSPQHSPCQPHEINPQHASNPPGSPPPAAAAMADGGAAADASAAVPGTPPQLPARPARPADASEDGGSGADCRACESTAAASRAADPATAPSSTHVGPDQHRAAAALPAQAQCAAAEQAAAVAQALLPPNATSPFDRALAAHLAVVSEASTPSASNGWGSTQAAVSAAGGCSDGPCCVTARLPSEPVVRSSRHQATPGKAAGPNLSIQSQQQPPLLQQPRQCGPNAATDATAVGGLPADQAPCGAATSTAISSRLPAERLRDLAAQQLSPPPWSQPAALTPTGHTAQVTTLQSIQPGHNSI